MPRTLKFEFKGHEIECGLNKIDRSKLYGSVDIETRDINGDRCALATLANDGKTLIPYGGTAFGYINNDGEWVERSDLKPVDLTGDKLEVLPSSFDETIVLEHSVTLEEFLDHGIRLCYQLDPEQEFDADFLAELHCGTIFRFGFLYREGITPDPAFLLSDQDGPVWMMVGKPAQIAFTGLDQAAVCFANQDMDDGEEDSDDFDFEML